MDKSFKIMLIVLLVVMNILLGVIGSALSRGNGLSNISYNISRVADSISNVSSAVYDISNELATKSRTVKLYDELYERCFDLRTQDLIYNVSNRFFRKSFEKEMDKLLNVTNRNFDSSLEKATYIFEHYIKQQINICNKKITNSINISLSTASKSTADNLLLEHQYFLKNNLTDFENEVLQKVRVARIRNSLDIGTEW